MKKYNFVFLFFIGFLISSPMAGAKNYINQRVPFGEQLTTHSLKHYEIQNIKIENDSGQQRVFSIKDGFQERVLRKVVHWLNNSSRVNGTSEVSLDNPSNKLTLKMANGEVITIEPAYTCVTVNKRKTCTAKDGNL
ncbi:hypothetical protein ACFQWC_00350 [Rossellomorea sp. GCM10028870]|uniref:hypothetical protein n=1 Tax=unclassified Rossellomorea TaxID=2837526 RepID=UPI0030E12E27